MQIMARRSPGTFDNGVLSAAVAFAERKHAFAIVDPRANAVADSTSPTSIDSFLGVLPRSQNAALYFPYLNSIDPITGLTTPMAPSGFVAGVYARTDLNRGVWKAPAGLEATLLNTTGGAAVRPRVCPAGDHRPVSRRRQ